MASTGKPYHHNKQCDLWYSYTGLPTCGPRCTGFPVEIGHGDISKSDGDMNGSVATFSCDDGFVLTGTASITCSVVDELAPWPTPEQKPVCNGTLISDCRIC